MSRKLTTKEFVKRVKKTHGDFYNYSLVDYVNSKTKVIIVCPKHGDFKQNPSSHITGKGCPKCGIGKNASNQRCDTEGFLKKAKKIHGENYDYSLVNYISAIDKVKIICKKHGIFAQAPTSHLSGSGCLHCGVARSASSPTRKGHTQHFIKKVHKNKYDYSKSNYKTAIIKVDIFCKKHGIFSQSPNSHLNGRGCPSCKNEKTSKRNKNDINETILAFNKVHKNKYDYSKVKYKLAHEKVKIICPNHGEFFQAPSHHLRGSGCNECGIDSLKDRVMKKGSKSFVRRAKEVHGNTYDYTNSVYVAAKKFIKVTCKIHGSFFVTPDNHISKKSGCAKCGSSKGEIKVRNFLIENKVKFSEQKRFKYCVNKKSLPFDFSAKDVLIEYQGRQHYKIVDFFGGESGLKYRRKNDQIKRNYCKKNKIPLLEIRYDDEDWENTLKTFLTKHNVIDKNK